ncbi:MAG: hypothetical protein IT426_12715 [Pirellulales bacterium]|nr:hypothetical protein [Pirellulales bacterium]
MSEQLQEFCDSRGVPMRVDRAAGVIRGVKILGLKSRNGRTYLPEALREAAALYENAKVNVNHPQGHPASPRDYRDRLGQIRGVELRPDAGLFGDLHFNPKHALAEQLAWDAEHAPENVGFSHNVEARTARRGEEVVVEAITRVQSVDLVADPATTRGLFESHESREAAESPASSDLPQSASELEKLDPRLIEEFDRRHAASIEKLQAEIAAISQKLAAHEARPHLATEERKPVSRDQHLPVQTPPANAKAFVEAIT